MRLKLFLSALALVAACSMAATSIARADLALTTMQDRIDNQLQLRQLYADNVTLVSPEGITHQNYTCWQVIHGSWNGQTLDGLSLVIAKQTGEANGAATHDRCIFVSDGATPAQRDALVAAVSAANPSWFSGLKDIRIEPAAIEIEELGGTIYVLHVGRIA